MAPTLQSWWRARSPNRESFKVVLGTGSSELVFLTVKVKVTSAPVSGTEVGSAVLVTVISGATSENDTVAVAESSSVEPSLSTTTAVKVLEWSGPDASPETSWVTEKSQDSLGSNEVVSLQSSSPVRGQ